MADHDQIIETGQTMAEPIVHACLFVGGPLHAQSVGLANPPSEIYRNQPKLGDYDPTKMWLSNFDAAGPTYVPHICHYVKLKSGFVTERSRHDPNLSTIREVRVLPGNATLYIFEGLV